MAQRDLRHIIARRSRFSASRQNRESDIVARRGYSAFTNGYVDPTGFYTRPQRVGANGTDGINANLIAWYQFSGTANDASGKGHNGTATGALFTNDMAYFDATDDFISCGSDFIGVGDITITGWMRPKTAGEGQAGRIIDNGKFILQLYNNTLRWIRLTSDGSTYATSGIGAWALSTWQFFAAVRRKNGTCDVYIDNTKVTNNVASGTPVAGGTVYLGNDSTTAYTFDGNMDDIRIFNCELQPYQLLQIFNEGRYRKTVFTEDVFYGAKLFEVKSNATGDGIYTCNAATVDDTYWDDTTGHIKVFDVSGNIEVLNAAEFDPEPEYVRQLTAGDYLLAVHQLDDGGIERWVGVPFRQSAGGSAVRLAYCSEAAPGDNTIGATLDHTTGTAITVTCHICNGSALNAAVPRLADNDEIFITKIGATWYCTTVFDTSEDCVCTAP